MPHTLNGNTHDVSARRGSEQQTACVSDRCSEYVKHSPEAAIGLALAAGLAVGVGIGAVLAGSSSPNMSKDRQLAYGLGERVMGMFDRNLPNLLGKLQG